MVKNDSSRIDKKAVGAYSDRSQENRQSQQGPVVQRQSTNQGATMPHVTFIHGLANKPTADILHQIWRYALAKGVNDLDQGAEGVTTTMVYWADVLYPTPDPM